ncbi:MAG TPA: iron ABC transporter permease [Chloroflexota bacterium]
MAAHPEAVESLPGAWLAPPEASPGMFRRTWLQAGHGLSLSQLILVLVLGLATLLPLAYLLANSFNLAPPTQASFVFGFGNWTAAYANPDTVRSIWTTVWLAAARTAIALPVAILFAWLIARTNMPGGAIVEFGMWVAYSLPVLSLVMGWILLLDPKSGLVNVLLGRLPFGRGAALDIYSYWGIIWLHLVTRSIPILVILMVPAFRRVGARLEEVSRMCGASRITTLARVTAPVLAPAIAPLAILSFLAGLQSLDIELIIGIPAGIFVYGTRIYNLVGADKPQYGAATALGAAVLLILLLLAVVSTRLLRNREYTTVNSDFSTARVDLGPLRWLWFALCMLFLAVGIVVPTAATILASAMTRFGFFDIKNPYTSRYWGDVFHDANFTLSLRNSVLLGLAAAVIGVILYTWAAHASLRHRGTTVRAIDFLAWIPRGIPGVLLSLALLWLFLTTPLRAVLYGTLFGMAIAVVINSLPTGVQLAKSSLIQIGHEMEDASRMCGASGSRTATQVLLPLMSPMLFTVGALVFVQALSEFSQIVLIYAPGSQPLSILMLQYIVSGQVERGAVLGVFMTAIVACLALGARFLSRKLGPK